MNRHSIVALLGPTDTEGARIGEKGSVRSEIQFIEGNRRLGHGVGTMLDHLAERGMYPSEAAIDLVILAATVTAADTRILREENAQDSWTREISLYVPVSDPERWRGNAPSIERILKFLTGDLWRLGFRPRPEGLESLIQSNGAPTDCSFDSVCLFSGGLDSYTGAIDLLADKRSPLFVSHYKDASTKSQESCAQKLGEVYVSQLPRHVRVNVSFDENDLLLGQEGETTTRGRSFIFFALAAMAADALEGETTIYVPENGLISLNVPLDPLRLGAWSTRTTHPFYMAHWQKLLERLGIEARLLNPYRFKTKGEMLAECKNKDLLSNSLDMTISCSSVTKSRWKGRPPCHCGYCVPCLIRRASIHAAFGDDPTEYALSVFDEHPLDARKAEAREVRSFQMMSRRISRNPALADILVRKTGPFKDYGLDELRQYADVFRRGIREVGDIVDNIKIASK